MARSASRKSATQILILFVFIPLLNTVCGAQAYIDPTLELGMKPYGTFEGGSIDSVSMTNGSLNLHIPLVSYPQRGGRLHFGFYLMYVGGSYVYTPTTSPSCKTQDGCVSGNQISGGLLQVVPDFEVSASSQGANTPPPHTAYAIVHTSDGSPHEVTSTSNGWRTIDATGYLCLSYCATIIDRDGIRHTMDTGGYNFSRKIEDPNGNFISGAKTTGASVMAYTDTMNRTVAVPPALGLGGSGYTSDFSGCSGTLTTVTAYIWWLPAYGGPTSYKFCYANVYYGSRQCIVIKGVTQSCGITDLYFPVLQSIVLPNSTTWTFTWDSDNPNNEVGASGTLLQVSFPTGGYIKYQWQPHYFCGSTLNNQSTTYAYTVRSRTINASTTSDGTADHTTAYSFSDRPFSSTPGTFTNSSTDALGDNTVYTVTPLSSTCSYYVTKTQTYDPTGAIVKTVATDYFSTTDPFYQNLGPTTSANTVPIRVTTTWPNGTVSKTETDYDSGISGYLYGIPTAERTFDYGSGIAGNLLRETFINSLELVNSYLANNLLTPVSSQQVCSPPANGEQGNCAGNTLVQRAYTQNTFDQPLSCGPMGGSSPCTSNISQNHEASPDGVYRGNVTTVGRWLNTSGGYLNTTATFLDTGMVNTSTDPNGNTSSFQYSPTYDGAYL